MGPPAKNELLLEDTFLGAGQLVTDMNPETEMGTIGMRTNHRTVSAPRGPKHDQPRRHTHSRLGVAVPVLPAGHLRWPYLHLPMLTAAQTPAGS